MINNFLTYFHEIQNTYLSQEAREVSYRTSLENLLNESKPSSKIQVIHEGKREGKFGIPDFKIKQNEGIIGYIETKIIGENLDKILLSEQIKKYILLSDNILLTNYLEWIWIQDGAVMKRENLAQVSDLADRKKVLSPENIAAVAQLIQHFFSTPPKGVSTPKKLAESLAIRARFLQDLLAIELQRQMQDDKKGKLYGLYETFQSFIFKGLTIAEFADAFAQNLAYGLFLARLNANTNRITLYNVGEFIPNAFELIRELVDFLKELNKFEYKETKWIIEEILALLNELDLDAIQKSLSFIQKKGENESEGGIKDPYIYFYEDFLAAYNPDLRKAKGVYYTPPAVVNFIVRGIEAILKQNFQIKEGLSNSKKVTILDFATGTGTFLIEILQQIFANTPTEKRKKLIKEHILKNIYGFEYLIAPYTIAHLKISQFLKEQNYEFSEEERLQIYLTNTLEPISAQRNFLVPALSKESEEAQKIKNKPILVICGNPPYSVSSSNKSPYIDNSLKLYKERLGEQKTSLDDDYVKFIRFAHQKITKVGNGVVAIITNNSYLDGITHRKMRESLLHDFDKLYILNLHGNSIKKEGDENVFDIRVGVSMFLAIKAQKPVKEKEVLYFSTKDNGIDKRKEKYLFCLENDLNSVNWIKLQPHAPNFWFVPKNLVGLVEYNQFWSVKDIFNVYSTGIKTKIDSIAIDFQENTLVKRIKDILDTKYRLSEIITKFNLKKNTTWEHERAIKVNFDKNKITDYDYRPFSRRKIYYDKDFLSRSRSEVMDNFFERENIGLEVGRLEFIAFVSNLISDEHFCGSGSYKFPLYLYQKATQELDLSSNIPYQKALKKLQKEMDFWKTHYESQKHHITHIAGGYHNGDRQKALDNNEQVYEMQKARLEKDMATLEVKYNAKIEIEGEYQKVPNFSYKFQSFLAEKYEAEISPEQILAYMYAILHSPVYREKYFEFLKTDFPQIPFVTDFTVFQALTKIGEELIQAHLMKNDSLKVDLYEGEGNNEVQKSNGFSEKENRLYINKTQYFAKVTPEIWEFRIGAYPVLEKYLKDRKGQILNNSEIENVEAVVKILAFTQEKMQEIAEIVIMEME